MDSFNGSNGLATSMQPGDVVFNNSFDSGMKVKGGGEGCHVLHLSWCLFHELLPIIFSQPSIPETEKNMAEQYL